MAIAKHKYETTGKETGKIDVKLSFTIISLFSEGLYSSPHKAIEELVANAFDAGATNVHVVIPDDLTDPLAEIAVVDDGVGMDDSGLRTHWLIGDSTKRKNDYSPPKGRKPIGRFGIGKLSTYVLAKRYSHLTKSKAGYLLTSMDYGSIPRTASEKPKPVRLSLRKLTADEAKKLLPAHIINSSTPASKAIKLFGKDAAPTWTVAILSELKDMAREIQRGRLQWILSTAMPLGSDFKAFLSGKAITPSKESKEQLGSWTLGKDLLSEQPPKGYDLVTSKLQGSKQNGLTHPQVGVVAGTATLYRDIIATGKSTEIARSHGFFVYVRGRLINLDDEYFGIDSNLLRHGTFSRTRIVIHVDSLDDDLRSSRESLLESSRVRLTRELLQFIFNFVRSKHQAIEDAEDPTILGPRRLSESPSSLVRRPLFQAIAATLSGSKKSRLIIVPRDAESRQTLVKQYASLDQASGDPIKSIVIDGSLSPSSALACFDAQEGAIKINERHPFVAYFQDAFRRSESRLALELFATTEVLLEANLMGLGLSDDKVYDIIQARDELLRVFARSKATKGPNQVAQELEEASNEKKRLELAVVAAFECMGFSEAVPVGGSGKPDGLAEAKLLKDKSYRVTLEAKSKETGVGKVSAKTAGISTVARHRADSDADHAVIVGPDFPTKKEDAALATEIKADRASNPGKTITVIRIAQLAQLVRLVPAKRVGLSQLRTLFTECETPEDCDLWINKLLHAKEEPNYFSKLLSVIESEQSALKKQVKYENIQTALRLKETIDLEVDRIKELCKAIAKMAPGYLSALEETVELEQRPDLVLKAISEHIGEYPDDEKSSLKALLK